MGDVGALGEVVQAAQLGRESRRGGHVAHFPARDVEGFAKAANDERAAGQARQARGAFVPQRVVD